VRQVEREREREREIIYILEKECERIVYIYIYVGELGMIVREREGPRDRIPTLSLFDKSSLCI